MPNDSEASAPQPTVKVTPAFKVGETVVIKATRAKAKIEKIREGNLRLSGIAGWIVPTSVEKDI